MVTLTSEEDALGKVREPPTPVRHASVEALKVQRTLGQLRGGSPLSQFRVRLVSLDLEGAGAGEPTDTRPCRSWMEWGLRPRLPSVTGRPPAEADRTEKETLGWTRRPARLERTQDSVRNVALAI